MILTSLLQLFAAALALEARRLGLLPAAQAHAAPEAAAAQQQPRPILRRGQRRGRV
jgi:hypothetical protein